MSPITKVFIEVYEFRFVFPLRLGGLCLNSFLTPGLKGIQKTIVWTRPSARESIRELRDVRDRFATTPNSYHAQTTLDFRCQVELRGATTSTLRRARLPSRTRTPTSMPRRDLCSLCCELLRSTARAPLH